MQGKTRWREKKKASRPETSEATIKNQSSFKAHPQNSSNLEMEDFDQLRFEPSAQFKEYLFNHTFNEYVRLTLVKILPLKNKNMQIKREEAILVGPAEECEGLKNKVSRELQRYAMKMIRFYREQDIEEIEFHLNPDYEVKVYRIKYVELAAKEVAKHYNFTIEVQNLINKMKTQKQILVRILKTYTDKCVADINNIVNNSDLAKTEVSKKDISMASFVTAQQVNDSGIISKQHSASSESIHSSDGDEEPSYYEIPGVIKTQNDDDSFSMKVRTEPPTRRNRSSSNLLHYMSEPTEDDSVSVAEKKKTKKQMYQQKDQYNFKKPARPLKQKKETMEIIRYEMQEQEFDEDDFKEWLKERHGLPVEEVIVEKERDPYNDQFYRYIIKLVVPCDISQDKQENKKEVLEYYFKFKKVIFVKLKNDLYKKQLINEYTKSEESLTIEFVKGYKSPKWKENTMWQHILKKNYTSEKKSANTEYFEAFFMQGLKSLVVGVERQLKSRLNKEPVEDVVEQLMFKIDELADHFRDNDRVKELLVRHVRTVIADSFGYICKVKELNFVLTALKISLSVKFDKQEQYHQSSKQQILTKLLKEFKIQQFDSSFLIDKFTYQKLQKNITIVDKDERSFKFVCSAMELSEHFNKINIIMNSVNSIHESEVKVDDLLQGKLVNQYINQLIKEQEFADIKFNTSCDKNIYVFKFYGRKYILDAIETRIEEHKKEIQQNRLTFHQIVRPKEKEILHNQDLIEKIHQKYNICLQPTESLLDCYIQVIPEHQSNGKKLINIKKTKSLDYVTLGSAIVFRSMAEIDEINSPWTKTYKNYLKKHNQTTSFNEKSRNYTFMIKSNISTRQMLKEVLDLKEGFANIAMMMPTNDKLLFLKQLIAVFIEDKQYLQRKVQILLLEREDKVDLKETLGIREYKRGQQIDNVDRVDTKYYVSEKEKKFFYSAGGNRKIEEALKKGSKSVILNNEDLSLAHVSHQFDPKSSTMRHLQSQNTCPVTFQGGKVMFTLKGTSYQMPFSEAQKVQLSLQHKMADVDLSLGIYEVKFDTMEQVNLFSGYSRSLMKEEKVIKADKTIDRLQVYYNVKIGQIAYQYSGSAVSSNQLSSAIQEVKDFLLGSFKQKEFSLKGIPQITKEDIEKLKQDIEEDQTTECSYQASTERLFVKLYDQNEFLKVEWRIKLLESTLKKEQVQFPTYWAPQKEDIQEFNVPEGSAEFNRVQNLFTCGKIKSLIRIQNKIIYKKYYQQGLFLKNLNGGAPVKTMELFHGTRNTKPEQIYKDKEESFNINYSSDSNLLGRGIYFAERSEYSNSYRYTENVAGAGIFGAFKQTNLYSMFLCEVYVGQSQKCLKHDGGIKDTNYRDTVKQIRYQSMTDYLDNSNIYVVYKSRRAYPMYLIKY